MVHTKLEIDTKSYESKGKECWGHHFEWLLKVLMEEKASHEEESKQVKAYM